MRYKQVICVCLVIPSMVIHIEEPVCVCVCVCVCLGRVRLRDITAMQGARENIVSVSIHVDMDECM
jgi:hypothetical protein